MRSAYSVQHGIIARDLTKLAKFNFNETFSLQLPSWLKLPNTTATSLPLRCQLLYLCHYMSTIFTTKGVTSDFTATHCSYHCHCYNHNQCNCYCRCHLNYDLLVFMTTTATMTYLYLSHCLFCNHYYKYDCHCHSLTIINPSAIIISTFNTLSATQSKVS